MAERKIDMKAHIAGVTECPICVDKISDNRLLPCGHTFCLKCLEHYKRTIKSKGKSLHCPVCRNVFSIPQGGCCMFPKNAIVDKILGIESKQDDDTKQCVLCAKGKKAISTVHCIECDQSFCGDCERTHSKLRTCFTHHIIPVSKTSQLGDCTSKSYCSNHPNYVLRVMCNDCNKLICSKCRLLTHEYHTLPDVGELADSYSEQLQSNIEEIGQRLSIMDKLSEDIKDQEKQTQENFDREKERVSETAAGLIRCIIANEDKLIEQLSSSMKRNLKALQPYKLQVESHSDLLRKHKISVEHLKKSGNIWEILRNAGEFHKTASKLLSSDLITINNLTLSSLTESQIQNHLIGTNSISEDVGSSVLEHSCSLESTLDALSNEDYNGLRAADTITSTVCPSEVSMNAHFQSKTGQYCDENQYETITVTEFNANWKSSSSPMKGSSGSPLLGSSSAVIDSDNRKWPLAVSNDRTASAINAPENVFQAELEMAMKNRVKKRPVALPKKAQYQAGCQKRSDSLPTL